MSNDITRERMLDFISYNVMALKSGMTLILPLEILLVYVFRRRLKNLYLNMFNDLIMF